jgi:nucleotide-binding universal stress UspA family protein
MAATAQRIVVDVDGSDGARLAVACALGERARREAAVEVVSAFPVEYSWLDHYLLDQRRIDSVRADTEARARARVDTVLAYEPPNYWSDLYAITMAPADVLVRQEEGAGLLVVGSRSHSRLEGLVLGSVALHAAMHGPCPVLVVRPSASGRTQEPGRVAASAFLAG